MPLFHTAPPDPTGPMVAFDAVTRRHGKRAAVADLSLRVERGRFVQIVGPSGAGKSTVLRLVAALDTPTAGQVRVAGQDVARLGAGGRALLRRSLGLVLQQVLLLPDRNVLDNVMLPALASGLPRRAARTRACTALERVRLAAPQWTERPDALSGGEQQRAALARALVNQPALLLADEPTAHLDAAAAADVLGLLSEFNRAGVTVLLASHGESMALPADVQVVRLADGRVLA